jgi:hypothetical protein
MPEHPSAVSPEQVARLRELLAKATPGPWSIYEHSARDLNAVMEELFYQASQTEDRQDKLWLLNADGKCPGLTGCGPTSAANAALITEAVNALPALLNQIEAMRSALEAADRIIENTIVENDGPNRVHWRGHIIEGVAADMVHSTLRTFQKLARAALLGVSSNG